MRWVRPLFLPVILCCAIGAHAQVSGRKKLITSLGYGIAGSHFTSDSLSSGSTGTALDFSFDYGIAPKWAIGLHYQRMGAHRLFGQDLSARSTTYELLVTYALIARERSALDAMLGFGAGLTAFTVKGDRLSADAQAGVLSLGLRYWRCLTPCVGIHVTTWFSSVADGALTYADQGLVDGNGGALTVAWRSEQTTLGVLVRF